MAEEAVTVTPLPVNVARVSIIAVPVEDDSPTRNSVGEVPDAATGGSKLVTSTDTLVTGVVSAKPETVTVRVAILQVGDIRPVAVQVEYTVVLQSFAIVSEMFPLAGTMCCSVNVTVCFVATPSGPLDLLVAGAILSDLIVPGEVCSSTLELRFSQSAVEVAAPNTAVRLWVPEARLACSPPSDSVCGIVLDESGKE